VNTSTGTITTLVGANGTRTMTAQLDNQGTITVNHPLTINRTSAVHSNSGTIDILGGDLVLSQSGTTPSFTNTGSINIGLGRTWTINGGTLNQNSGAIAGAGLLSFNTITANFATDFSTATTGFTSYNSTINGPGKLTNPTGKTLAINHGTINAEIINQGILNIGGLVNQAGSISNAASGTVRLQGNNIYSTATLNVT